MEFMGSVEGQEEGKGAGQRLQEGDDGRTLVETNRHGGLLLVPLQVTINACFGEIGTVQVCERGAQYERSLVVSAALMVNGWWQ